MPAMISNASRREGMRAIRAECVATLLAGLVTAAIGGWIVHGTPGELWRDDFQASMMPGYWDMHRAFHEGSFPLISPYSWCGGRLGGEYVYGVFSVFHEGVLRWCSG